MLHILPTEPWTRSLARPSGALQPEAACQTTRKTQQNNLGRDEPPPRGRPCAVCPGCCLAPGAAPGPPVTSTGQAACLEPGASVAWHTVPHIMTPARPVGMYASSCTARARQEVACRHFNAVHSAADLAHVALHGADTCASALVDVLVALASTRSGTQSACCSLACSTSLIGRTQANSRTQRCLPANLHLYDRLRGAWARPARHLRLVGRFHCELRQILPQVGQDRGGKAQRLQQDLWMRRGARQAQCTRRGLPSKA